MIENEKMIEDRVVWEKLKNIQIFCGLGKFFFAFKELNPEIDLDHAFIKLLSPESNSHYLENDYKRKEYQPFSENKIFKYDKMPSVFYLRKIFYYCRLDESDYGESHLNLQKEREKFKQAQLYQDENFKKTFIQHFINKKNNSDFGEDTDFDYTENSFDYKDIIFIRKLYKLLKLSEKNKKFQKICNEYSQFVTNNDIIWENFLDPEQLEELEFLELLYQTKIFDNDKGKEALLYTD